MWSLTITFLKELWVNLLNFNVSLAYPGLCKKTDKLDKKKDHDEVGEWH